MAYTKPIIDAHTHILHHNDGIDRIIELTEGYGYQRANVLAAESYHEEGFTGSTQNSQALLLKARRPDWWAFGSLNHSDGDFAGQLKTVMALGFDGLKMIEGKPDTYKRLGSRPINGPEYDGMYAAAEAAGFPLLMHVADPPELWDPENAPDFAREHGWLYVGEGYPTLEELYGQVEDILTRFPKLTVIFAHFLFLSNDRERAADLLTRHPNAHFDLTPGTEMFLNFAEDPAAWREFFLRFQDRLLFGTDDWDVQTDKEKRDKDDIDRMLRTFLEKDGPYEIWGWKLHGIGLPESALDKIYRENYRRVAGGEPRLLNRPLAVEFVRSRLAQADRYGCTGGERQDLREILAELEAGV